MKLSERMDRWYCNLFHGKCSKEKDTHWHCKKCNLYFKKSLWDDDLGPP